MKGVAVMTVEPIRDRDKIEIIYRYLNQKDPKYGLLFKFGLNTGLRISDILPLKVEDVLAHGGEFQEYLVLKEQKTGKEKKIKVNESLRKEIRSYVKAYNIPYHGFLFPSRKGSHIGRVQAYRVFQEAASINDIQNFGTHSLRKTWGYWTYKESRYNIGLIMEALNHSSQKITLRYIGVNQDQKDELYSLVQF
jgi:integrase